MIAFHPIKTRFLSTALIAAITGYASLMAAQPQRQDGPKQTKDASISLEDLRAKRSELAHRKRRIIYNNDGGEFGDKEFRKRGIVSPQAFLDVRTSGLAGSQVDSIFYSTSASGLGMYTHDTRVGDRIGLSPDGTPHMARNYIDAGLDPIRMMLDFARAHSIELFWSIRMNDTHDGNIAAYGDVRFNQNTFKKKHPEDLLGTYDRQSTAYQSNIWSAVNYALPEVQDYAVAIIEEVCRNYDIDGIELDFFRHLGFFKSAFEKKPATPEEIAAMNGLVQRIRALTEKEGLRRGRPILVAVKVPDSVPYARAAGLDLERWLKEKWVDILVPGGYFQLNPWEYSVALGHRYGVPVYPSLDEPRVLGKENIAAVKRRRLLPSYRGRAMDVWEAGGDGVYLYNIFLVYKPASEIFRELGDPGTLRFLDKDYFANARGYAGNYGVPSDPYRDHESLSMLYPPAPVNVTTNATKIPFSVADDFEAARQAGKHPTTRLHLWFKEPLEPSSLSVLLNGTPLSATAAEALLSFDVEPAAFRKGKNILEVKLNANVASKVLLTDLQVEVRYAPESK